MEVTGTPDLNIWMGDSILLAIKCISSGVGGGQNRAKREKTLGLKMRHTESADSESVQVRRVNTADSCVIVLFLLRVMSRVVEVLV